VAVVGASAAIAVALGGWSPVRAGPNEVVLQHVQFVPATLTIAPGETVTWRHDDGSTPHSVTADDGSFDSNASCIPSVASTCLAQGQTFARTFPDAGTFRYHCKVHGSMTGTVMVTAPVDPTTLPETPPPTTPVTDATDVGAPPAGSATSLEPTTTAPGTLDASTGSTSSSDASASSPGPTERAAPAPAKRVGAGSGSDRSVLVLAAVLLLLACCVGAGVMLTRRRS